MTRKQVSSRTASLRRGVQPAEGDGKTEDAPIEEHASKMDSHQLFQVPFHTSPNYDGASGSANDFAAYCIDAAGYDNDPVEKEWAIFLNPPPGNRHVVVLRYPHRSSGDPYLARKGQQPLEIRIKPRSGLVEVDVPLHIHQKTYDKHRGIMYGEAMRKNEILQAGGSFGVRGGLGNPVTTNRRSMDTKGPTNRPEPSDEELLDDIDRANASGHVMNKITMAGVITPWEETDPVYFLAIFKQNSIGADGNTESHMYLTKVDAIVELNPILDHVDALRDNEKATSTRGARATGEQADEGEARAVNMTVKTMDEEGEEMETLGERSEIIKAMNTMRDEPWQTLQYHDSETLEAWDQYDGALTQPHPEILPRLVSSMSNEQWMDAISAPRDDPTRLTERAMALPKKTKSMKRGRRKSGEQNVGSAGQHGKGPGDGEAETQQADQELHMNVDSSDKESANGERGGDDDVEESDKG